jgi:hypothetical protein
MDGYEAINSFHEYDVDTCLIAFPVEGQSFNGNRYYCDQPAFSLATLPPCLSASLLLVLTLAAACFLAETRHQPETFYSILFFLPSCVVIHDVIVSHTLFITTTTVTVILPYPCFILLILEADSTFVPFLLRRNIIAITVNNNHV